MSRSWTRIALGVAVAATLAISTAGAAGARVVSPSAAIDHNVNISKMKNNQAEHAIGINPTNPKNVVVISNLDVGDGLFKSYSLDGGKTWTSEIIADGDNLGIACCDGSLSFDQYGNLFMTYLNATDGKIPVALSIDGGQTFNKIKTIVPTGPARPAGQAGKGFRSDSVQASGDQPTITAGAGTVWVTYTSTKIQAAGAPVTGLGQVGSWVGPQNAGGTNASGDYGDIAINSAGQVMITYQNPTGGEGPAKIFTDLDPDGLGPQGFRAAVLFNSTNVGGFDYIPAQSGRSVDAEVGLAYDRSGGAHQGRLYSIWTQETPDESNNTDVIFQFSDDNGAHWSTAVKVNDDTTTRSQFNPKLALDQTTGNIAICWYDARNDNGDHGPGDTNGKVNDDAQQWCTDSTDGGSSFAANFQVSKGTSNDDDANNGIDYGDYGGLAFYGGQVHPLWADNSNSTGDNPDGTLHQFDLYTTRFRVR